MIQPRRDFLRQVAFSLPAPFVLGATDKAGSKLPVVGSGAYTYEAIHDWGTLPPGIKYGNTHGVCEDSNGNIYVHHTVFADSQSSDSMVVFDEHGKFVRSWGSRFRGGAHGLHIRKEGSTEFLYLCDTKHAIVVKSTLTGEEVWTLEYPFEAAPYSHPGPDGKPLKYSPTNLAVAPNGDVYVADGYGSSYVNQYSAAGKYIRTFGGPGKEPGKLLCPHGILCDTRQPVPVIVIADRTNRRLQRFSLAGEPIDIVDGFPAPCHFNVFSDGDVVLPDLFARVTILDRMNHVAAQLGDDSHSDYMATRKLSRDHFQPGKFVCPHGACFDHNKNIFVVEWVEVGRVTKLRKV